MDAPMLLFTVLRLLLAAMLLTAAAGKLLHRPAHIRTLAQLRSAGAPVLLVFSGQLRCAGDTKRGTGGGRRHDCITSCARFERDIRSGAIDRAAGL